MGYILKVIDENGNEIPFNRIKIVGNSSLITKNGCDEITIQILDKKSEIFSDEEIHLIMDSLHKQLSYGGSYHKMKKIVELIDKLNEENTINE